MSSSPALGNDPDDTEVDWEETEDDADTNETTPTQPRRSHNPTPDSASSFLTDLHRPESPSPHPRNAPSMSRPFPSPYTRGVHGAAPYGRYEEDTCNNLYDLLLFQLPPPPLYRYKDAKWLTTTKELNLSEFGLSPAEQMTSIVYADRMLDPLLDIALDTISTHRLIWSDRHYRDFVATVHPYHTWPALPRVVHSEKDDEDWVLDVLVRPSMRAHLASVTGGIPPQHAEVETPEQCGEYVSSSDGVDKVVPDAVVMDGIRYRATVEVKTRKVLNSGNKFILAPLQKHHIDDTTGQECPGRAIKFIWPQNISDLSDDKRSRILVQVWTQMVAKKCDIGLLSSYESTVFFHKRGQTLYMSKVYRNTSNVLLATYCWTSLALGTMSMDNLDLPACDTSWWQPPEYYSRRGCHSGVVDPTLPGRTTPGTSSSTRTRR